MSDSIYDFQQIADRYNISLDERAENGPLNYTDFYQQMQENGVTDTDYINQMWDIGGPDFRFSGRMAEGAYDPLFEFYKEQKKKSGDYSAWRTAREFTNKTYEYNRIAAGLTLLEEGSKAWDESIEEMRRITASMGSEDLEIFQRTTPQIFQAGLQQIFRTSNKIKEEPWRIPLIVGGAILGAAAVVASGGGAGAAIAVGAGKGALGGMALTGGAVEGRQAVGRLRAEIVAMEDKYGERLTEKEARALALASGGFSAAIETIGDYTSVGSLLAPFGKMVKSAVARGAADKVFSSIGINVAKNAGKSMAINFAEETLQSLSESGVAALAVNIANGMTPEQSEQLYREYENERNRLAGKVESAVGEERLRIEQDIERIDTILGNREGLISKTWIRRGGFKQALGEAITEGIAGAVFGGLTDVGRAGVIGGGAYAVNKTGELVIKGKLESKSAEVESAVQAHFQRGIDALKELRGEVVDKDGHVSMNEQEYRAAEQAYFDEVDGYVDQAIETTEQVYNKFARKANSKEIEVDYVRRQFSELTDPFRVRDYTNAPPMSTIAEITGVNRQLALPYFETVNDTEKAEIQTQAVNNISEKLAQLNVAQLQEISKADPVEGVDMARQLAAQLGDPNLQDVILDFLEQNPTKEQMAAFVGDALAVDADGRVFVQKAPEYSTSADRKENVESVDVGAPYAYSNREEVIDNAIDALSDKDREKRRQEYVKRKQRIEDEKRRLENDISDAQRRGEVYEGQLRQATEAPERNLGEINQEAAEAFYTPFLRAMGMDEKLIKNLKVSERGVEAVQFVDYIYHLPEVLKILSDYLEGNIDSEQAYSRLDRDYGIYNSVSQEYKVEKINEEPRLRDKLLGNNLLKDGTRAEREAQLMALLSDGSDFEVEYSSGNTENVSGKGVLHIFTEKVQSQILDAVMDGREAVLNGYTMDQAKQAALALNLGPGKSVNNDKKLTVEEMIGQDIEQLQVLKTEYKRVRKSKQLDKKTVSAENLKNIRDRLDYYNAKIEALQGKYKVLKRVEAETNSALAKLGQVKDGHVSIEDAEQDTGLTQDEINAINNEEAELYVAPVVTAEDDSVYEAIGEAMAEGEESDPVRVIGAVDKDLGAIFNQAESETNTKLGKQATGVEELLIGSVEEDRDSLNVDELMHIYEGKGHEEVKAVLEAELLLIRKKGFSGDDLIKAETLINNAISELNTSIALNKIPGFEKLSSNAQQRLNKYLGKKEEFRLESKSKRKTYFLNKAMKAINNLPQNVESLEEAYQKITPKQRKKTLVVLKEAIKNLSGADIASNPDIVMTALQMQEMNHMTGARKASSVKNGGGATLTFTNSFGSHGSAIDYNQIYRLAKDGRASDEIYSLIVDRINTIEPELDIKQGDGMTYIRGDYIVPLRVMDLENKKLMSLFKEKNKARNNEMLFNFRYVDYGMNKYAALNYHRYSKNYLRAEYAKEKLIVKKLLDSPIKDDEMMGIEILKSDDKKGTYHVFASHFDSGKYGIQRVKDSFTESGRGLDGRVFDQVALDEMFEIIGRPDDMPTDALENPTTLYHIKSFPNTGFKFTTDETIKLSAMNKLYREDPIDGDYDYGGAFSTEMDFYRGSMKMIRQYLREYLTSQEVGDYDFDMDLSVSASRWTNFAFDHASKTGRRKAHLPRGKKKGFLEDLDDQSLNKQYGKALQMAVYAKLFGLDLDTFTESELAKSALHSLSIDDEAAHTRAQQVWDLYSELIKDQEGREYLDEHAENILDRYASINDDIREAGLEPYLHTEYKREIYSGVGFEDFATVMHASDMVTKIKNRNINSGEYAARATLKSFFAEGRMENATAYSLLSVYGSATRKVENMQKILRHLENAPSGERGRVISQAVDPEGNTGYRNINPDEFYSLEEDRNLRVPGYLLQGWTRKYFYDEDGKFVKPTIDGSSATFIESVQRMSKDDFMKLYGDRVKQESWGGTTVHYDSQAEMVRAYNPRQYSIRSDGFGQMVEKVFDRFDKKGNVGLQIVDRLNQFSKNFKSFVFVANAFHPMALGRSAIFGPSYIGRYKAAKNLNINPAKYFLRPLATGTDIRNRNLEMIRFLVSHGMSLDVSKDYASHHRQNKIIRQYDEINSKAGKTARNWLSKHRGLQNEFYSWVFEKFAPALKSQAAIAEFTQALDTEPERDVSEIAREVAHLMNADFGGLNIHRLGLSETDWQVISSSMLAADWTTSNTLASFAGFLGPLYHRADKAMKRRNYRLNPSKKTYKKFLEASEKLNQEEMGKHFRAFVGRVMVSGMTYALLANFVSSGGDLGELARRYEESWNDADSVAGSIYNMFDADITKLYELFGIQFINQKRSLNIVGHLADPVKWIRNFSENLGSTAVSKSNPLIQSLVRGVITKEDYTSQEYMGFDQMLRMDSVFDLLQPQGATTYSRENDNSGYIFAWLLSELPNYMPGAYQNAAKLALRTTPESDTAFGELKSAILEESTWMDDIFEMTGIAVGRSYWSRDKIHTWE